MLEGEKDGVAEPSPANESHGDESIAGWTLVDIQHQARVKGLREDVVSCNDVDINLPQYTDFPYAIQLSRRYMPHPVIKHIFSSAHHVYKIESQN